MAAVRGLHDRHDRLLLRHRAGEQRRDKLAEGGLNKGFLTARALVAVLSAMPEPGITLLLHEKADGISLHELPYSEELRQDGRPNPAIAKNGEHIQARSGDDTPDVLSIDRKALRDWLRTRLTGYIPAGDRPCKRLGCDQPGWRPYSPWYCPRHFAENALQVLNRPPKDTAHAEHEVQRAGTLDGCLG